MKKALLFLIVLSLIATMLFISCTPTSDSERANVIFSIAHDRARTLMPDIADMEVKKYRFTLSGQESYTKEFEKSSKGTYEFFGVKPGSYNITCTGLSESGKTVVESSVKDKLVMRGENILSFTFDKLVGNGSLNLSIEWNPSSYDVTPTLNMTVYDEKNSVVSIPESAIDKSKAKDGKVAISHTLPSGSYLFIFTLTKNGEILIGYTEVVRISNGATTTGKIDFTLGGSVSSNFGITNNTSTPIEGNILASKSEEGVTCSIDFSTLPEGVTKDDLTITWYNEDLLVGYGLTVGFMPFEGTSRVTAVVKCSKVGSMGSTTTYYTYN